MIMAGLSRPDWQLNVYKRIVISLATTCVHHKPML
nr:MAG TPA: hypothetical protein [Caudoviricetes sp.]